MKKVKCLIAWTFVFLLLMTGVASADIGGTGSGEDAAVNGTADSARVVNTYVQYENKEPYVGDEVILIAELAGFVEGLYKIQWQYSPDEGEHWLDAEGATDRKYAFLLTFDNLNYRWRVTVEDLSE